MRESSFCCSRGSPSPVAIRGRLTDPVAFTTVQPLSPSTHVHGLAGTETSGSNEHRRRRRRPGKETASRSFYSPASTVVVGSGAQLKGTPKGEAPQGGRCRARSHPRDGVLLRCDDKADVVVLYPTLV